MNFIIDGNSQPQVAMTGFGSPTPYVVVNYSSYYNNDSLYEPWKAFDNATGTSNRWLMTSRVTQHVTLDLGTSYDVNWFSRVDILPGDHISGDYGTRSVRDFNILVSNDMETWTNVLSVSGVSGWQAGITKSFTI